MPIFLDWTGRVSPLSHPGGNLVLPDPEGESLLATNGCADVKEHAAESSESFLFEDSLHEFGNQYLITL